MGFLYGDNTKKITTEFKVISIFLYTALKKLVIALRFLHISKAKYQSLTALFLLQFVSAYYIFLVVCLCDALNTFKTVSNMPKIWKNWFKKSVCVCLFPSQYLVSWGKTINP